MKKIISIILILSFFTSNIFSQNINQAEEENQTPQWLKDFRRTEIISFGSLPFVTLWVTIGYSVFTYGEFTNPFSKSSSTLDISDQKKIIQIAALTSLGIGITDLVVNIIKRNSTGKRRTENFNPITVLPPERLSESITEEFERNSGNSSPYGEKNSSLRAPLSPFEKEYFVGEMENAVF